MYVRRALESVVRRHNDYFKVLVVTGPRQVGKTTMLKHLMEQDAEQGKPRNYVSLDDTNLLMLAKTEPSLFLQRYEPPVLIDEIQRAPELLPYIKKRVDESDLTGLYWLTGSQPFHLMKGVSESLAGRAAVIEMLGLSNAEISGIASESFDPGADYFMRRVREAPALDLNQVYERIFAGSLPYIRTLPADMHASAYESYLDTYIMRDIRELGHVADELKFRRFMAACAALTSKPVVYADLARMVDIDQKTAKAWLSLLVSSYLVKIVQPYSNNLLKRLSKQPVMHFTDTGLAAYLAGWESPRTLERGAMGGQIFESYVFGEIDKSFVNAGRKSPLWFFRNNDKKEIDLLMEAEGRLYPIEVKKSASPVAGDLKNFTALDPVASPGVPPELASFKREIGMGTLVCMAEDALPVNERAWAFPVWAI